MMDVEDSQVPSEDFELSQEVTEGPPSLRAVRQSLRQTLRKMSLLGWLAVVRATPVRTCSGSLVIGLIRPVIRPRPLS